MLGIETLAERADRRQQPTSHVHFADMFDLASWPRKAGEPELINIHAMCTRRKHRVDHQS
jgi:urease beta subunit